MEQAVVSAVVHDTSSRQPASAAGMAPWLGTWRDPWFGDVTICPVDDRVAFRSAKSPRLSGDLMRVGDRYLVDWHADHAEAWAHFSQEAGTRRLGTEAVAGTREHPRDDARTVRVFDGDCSATAALAPFATVRFERATS